MAPRRKRVTPLGEALRAAREALHFDQRALGAQVYVSARQVSRWENGAVPTAKEQQRLLEVLSEAPAPVIVKLANAFGIELEEDGMDSQPDVTLFEPVPLAPTPPAPPAPPPTPTPKPAQLRASLDAILYAVAEERDVLPRHLRAFAVELLHGVDRLGLTAREAAAVVGVPERSTDESAT